MKDLGKTIAKYRKEHKLNQSQLAKELENYDIYVKQNSISAWELGTATPNARQFLALCEILEIYDIYTDFIGQSPVSYTHLDVYKRQGQLRCLLPGYIFFYLQGYCIFFLFIPIIQDVIYILSIKE